MQIELEVKQKVVADISKDEAIKILFKTYGMEWALDEGTDFFIDENEFGENTVYKWRVTEWGRERVRVEDNADLFVALRNLVVAVYPNVRFRNDDYIYVNK